MSDQGLDDGLELLPADEDVPTPEEEVEAAAAAILEDPFGDVAEDPPEPFGRTWLFDFDAGRFVRSGRAPQEVRGRAALQVWLEMARRSARFAHDVFDETFGMEGPDSVIGSVSVEEETSDWIERLRDAWLTHDRVVAVENVDAVYLQDEGVLWVRSMDVVTDEEDAAPLSFDNLRVEESA